MKLIIPSHHKSQQAFIPLVTLIVLGILAVSLPITTKLVQQSQENRGRATDSNIYDTCIQGDTKCIGDDLYFCFSGDGETGWGLKTTGGCASTLPPASTNTTCLDDDSKCEGNSRYVCRYGVWELEETCFDGCDGNICKATKQTCTSFEYTDWTTCGSNGIQTRTVISSSPAGCTGGEAATSQECTPEKETNINDEINAGGQCDIVGDYSCSGDERLMCISEGGDRVWTGLGNCEYGCSEGYCKVAPTPAPTNSTCLDDDSKCEDSSRYVCRYGTWELEETCPDGCDGDICKLTGKTCTFFEYTGWGTCGSNGIQTRTVISSSPAGCTGGEAVTSQECTYFDEHTLTVPVSECIDYVTGDWTTCNEWGYQTRSVVGVPEGCSGGVEKPSTSQSCSLGKVTCTSFDFSDWGECTSNGIQTRSVLASYPESCSGGSPKTAQLCTYSNLVDVYFLFEKYGINVSGEITVDDYTNLQNVIKRTSFDFVNPLLDTNIIKSDLTDIMDSLYLTNEELLWQYLTGSDANLKLYAASDYLIAEALKVAETYGLPISDSSEEEIMDFIEENNIEIIKGNNNIIDYYKENNDDIDDDDDFLERTYAYLSYSGGWASVSFPNTIFITNNTSDEEMVSVVAHELVHIVQQDSYNSLGIEALGHEEMEFEAYVYQDLVSSGYFVPTWILSDSLGSINYEYENETPNYLEALLD